jgi:hypothetical protein
MGSGGSPVRCTSGGRCHCTEARRRLAAAVGIDQRAGHQRQLGTLLAEVEDHPSDEASYAADHSGQADLGVETCLDPGVAPLGGASRLLACEHSPLPFSWPSTPCGFL